MNTADLLTAPRAQRLAPLKVVLAALLAVGSAGPQQKADKAPPAADKEASKDAKAPKDAGDQKPDAAKAAAATSTKKSKRPAALPETFEKGLAAYYGNDH